VVEEEVNHGVLRAVDAQGCDDGRAEARDALG